MLPKKRNVEHGTIKLLAGLNTSAHRPNGRVFEEAHTDCSEAPTMLPRRCIVMGSVMGTAKTAGSWMGSVQVYGSMDGARVAGHAVTHAQLSHPNAFSPPRSDAPLGMSTVT